MARTLEKIFGFSYLSLKLSLALPLKGIMLWCSYLRSFIKSTNFSELEISLKNLISSVLLGKLKYHPNLTTSPTHLIHPLHHHPPSNPTSPYHHPPTHCTSPYQHPPTPPHPTTTHTPTHPPTTHHGEKVGP